MYYVHSHVQILYLYYFTRPENMYQDLCSLTLMTKVKFIVYYQRAFRQLVGKSIRFDNWLLPPGNWTR